MNTDLRKRLPFKFSGNEEADDGELIVDEQEQEEIISNLREEALRADTRSTLFLQAFIIISCFLHLVSFVNPNALSLYYEPPITFSRPCAFFQVLVHLNNLLLLLEKSGISVPRSSELPEYLPVSMHWTIGLASVAPLISILSGKSWQQCAWWGVSDFISIVVWIVLREIREGENNIKELEELKYDARGA